MKYINYILIVIGVLISACAKLFKDNNQYLLILGIVILMLGIYRIAKTIPSKNESEDNNTDT